MLGYYISQSNEYTFRTQPTASAEFTMSLQDMYTLQTVTMSMSNITYEGYESYIGFTGSISQSLAGGEYRATLYNAEAIPLEIWNGSIQIFASQSIDKTVYENKIPPVTSHESENRYIILT